MHNIDTVDIIIYGLHEEKMTIDMSDIECSNRKTQLLNQSLKNVYLYMTENLKLSDAHIYVYISQEFCLLKTFDLQYITELYNSLPIIVAYTDINLSYNAAGKKMIFRNLGIDLELKAKQTPSTSIIDRKEVFYSEDSIKSFKIPYEQKLEKYKLTQDICIKPLEPTLKQYIYSEHVLSLPFSIVKNKVAESKKLLPPIYMSSEQIQNNYNYSLTIPYSKDFKAFVTNNKGELVLKDKEIIESTRGIFKEVIAKATIMLFKGQGILKMSLPVRIFDKKSQLEKFCDMFNSLDYMRQAANVTDKIEKFKLVICMFLSNFYYGIGSKKPFTPYLGETLEGYYKDGSRLFIEHVCHEPPKDCILLINEQFGFRIYGNYEVKPKLKTNEVEIIFKGILTVEIHGDKIYVQLAHLANSGLIYGDRKLRLKDSFYFYYPSAGLKAFAKVGPTADNKRLDTLHGGIYYQHKDITFNSKELGKFLFKNIGSRSISDNPK